MGGDFPNVMGGGPAVVYHDTSAHYSWRLSERIVGVAGENAIPIQRAIYQNYGSDAAALLKRGTEIALVTYPTRYTHSPIEMIDERDVTATVDLLEAFATTPPSQSGSSGSPSRS